MTEVVLKKGREESVLRFHPWIFSGAVASLTGNPYEGETVKVLSSERKFLATGHWQKGSIAVRILSFTDEFMPDASGRMPLDFWRSRLSGALQMRASCGLPSAVTDCFRLVHGEGDSLPGLIVDVYRDVAVMQAHSAGMYLSAGDIAHALHDICGDSLSAVYNKSAATAPHKAGLSVEDGYLTGHSDVHERIVSENGHRFAVDWASGQKTGFFLDQRDNRQLVGQLSKGKKVLNLFCYTGGFSVYALNSGADYVVSVDSSAVAIGMLDRNVRINTGSDDASGRHKSVCADAIDYLKNSEGGKYNLIVVDPPAFAKHRDAVDNALRAYRRLNAAAIAKVANGGFVFTYSCSQAVDRKSFELAVFSAAVQSGRRVRILRRLTQPSDHPVSIYHPEGDYLKGLLLYVE